MVNLLRRIEEEALSAGTKYGPFASAHEGYGVLAEEMMELLDAIHENDREAVWKEALQVSAVALRIAHACGDEAFCRRSGMDAGITANA